MVHEKRNFGLDLMRALAILFVLIHHWVAGNLSPIPAFSKYVPYFYILGYYGVEIFFVLSGFLIGNIIIKGFLNEADYGRPFILNFWMRRWFRTLPLYYFILFVTIFTTAVIKGEAITGLWKYFLFLQNFFGYNNDFYGISWSLSIEEWFYLSFPIILLLVHRLLKNSVSRKNIIFIVIIIYLICPMLVRVFYSALENPLWSESLRKAVICREDSIAFGVLGAFWYNTRKQSFINNKKPMLFVGILLLVITSAVFMNDILSDYYYKTNDATFFSKTIYFSLVNLAVLFTLPYCFGVTCNVPIIKNSVSFISKISYSLYLTHVFVHHIVHKLIPKTGGIYTIINLILFAAICAGLSSLTYHFVENTFLKLRDKVWKEKYKPA